MGYELFSSPCCSLSLGSYSSGGILSAVVQKDAKSWRKGLLLDVVWPLEDDMKSDADLAAILSDHITQRVVSQIQARHIVDPTHSSHAHRSSLNVLTIPFDSLTDNLERETLINLCCTAAQFGQTAVEKGLETWSQNPANTESTGVDPLVIWLESKFTIKGTHSNGRLFELQINAIPTEMPVDDWSNSDDPEATKLRVPVSFRRQSDQE